MMKLTFLESSSKREKFVFEILLDKINDKLINDLTFNNEVSYTNYKNGCLEFRKGRLMCDTTTKKIVFDISNNVRLNFVQSKKFGDLSSKFQADHVLKFFSNFKIVQNNKMRSVEGNVVIPLFEYLILCLDLVNLEECFKVLLLDAQKFKNFTKINSFFTVGFSYMIRFKMEPEIYPLSDVKLLDKGLNYYKSLCVSIDLKSLSDVILSLQNDIFSIFLFSTQIPNVDNFEYNIYFGDFKNRFSKFSALLKSLSSCYKCNFSQVKRIFASTIISKFFNRGREFFPVIIFHIIVQHHN
jgi:hypothetical protein